MPNLLILEDDQAFRQMLTETLEEEYTVRAAGSADEALELASREHFDVVLTDVRMAGMDGLSFLAELRRRHGEIQSVVMTGFADSDAPGRALDSGVSDYLYKPFTMRQLLDSLERVVQRPKTRSFFARLKAGVRQLTGQAERSRAEAETHRDECCRAYYVAVRSRALALAAAYPLWLRFEQLCEDLEREQDPARVDQDFQALHRLIKAAARPGDRNLDVETFHRLYQKIASAEISSEELALAPFVRGLAADARQRSTDLASLHEKLWALTASGC